MEENGNKTYCVTLDIKADKALEKLANIKETLMSIAKDIEAIVEQMPPKP